MLNEADFKDIMIVRHVEEIHESVDLSLTHALLLNEVLNHEQVEAHLSDLLHEPLLLIGEVFRNHTRLKCVWSH